MAIISITIPDAQLARIVDGICLFHNYDGVKEPSETKGQFAKRMVATQVKNWVKTTEGNIAGNIARKSATDEVEVIVIT